MYKKAENKSPRLQNIKTLCFLEGLIFYGLQNRREDKKSGNNHHWKR